MRYTTYPVPPPEGCEWYVWEGNDGRVRIVLIEAEETRMITTLRVSSNRERNQRRIMDKMVLMRLSHMNDQRNREERASALEGLLGTFR